jgi:alpha,alpha-trehalase
MVVSFMAYVEGNPNTIPRNNIDNNGTTLEEFVKMAYPLLKEEHSWFMSVGNGHAVNISLDGFTYLLNRYHSNDTSPRPESYKEDYDTALLVTLTDQRDALFRNIRAGAETGWDFSSRWIPHAASGAPSLPAQQMHLNLSQIQTSDIVPPDLNAIMFLCEKNLATLAATATIDLPNDVAVYTAASAARREAIHAVLYDENLACWGDFNLTSHKR